VVAKVGTSIEAVRKWLDVKLQHLMKLLPLCIKVSDSFRREVIQVRVPPNARLVTFEAVSMYSNTNLDHAMKIMQLWLETYVPSASESILPTQSILDALELVMHHNIMQFGDSYFLHLIGTAMGTSVAVVFANLYFGWHEKELILPRYHYHFKRINHHARFINDVFFIWISDTDTIWKNLIQDYNSFGILKLEINEPSSQVNFLDLTLTISKGKIITKTFQKANNPHLYIPPHFEHTPGMIHGIIFTLLKTYYCQKSQSSDFVKLTNLLFKCHIKQGWDQAVIKNVF
jgi:hypothetical protein